MYGKQFLSFKRWIATSLLSLLTIAFVWQGMFLANDAAMADSMMLADAGDRVENKINSGLEDTKDFIDDTKKQVKKTANKNESRVDSATDNNSFLENKAERDSDRIEQKANKDAARTKDAVDETQNIIESTIDNVKNAFN